MRKIMNKIVKVAGFAALVVAVAAVVNKVMKDK